MAKPWQNQCKQRVAKHCKPITTNAGRHNQTVGANVAKLAERSLNHEDASEIAAQTDPALPR